MSRVQQTPREKIVRYLLREMPAEERDGFESEFAADEPLFDKVAVVEDELVGAYIRGEQTGHERDRFLKGYLSTAAGREHVELARSWMDYTASLQDKLNPPVSANSAQSLDAVERPDSILKDWRNRAPTRSGSLPMRLALVAAWLIAVAGGLWGMFMTLQLRQQISRLQTEQRELEVQQQNAGEQLRDNIAELKQELEQQGQTSDQFAPPPFVLSADTARGGDSRKPLYLLPGVSLVSLQINLPYNDYPAYDVSVETPEGTRIWYGKSLKSRTLRGGQSAIFIRLPVARLESRNYVVHVTGVGSNGATNGAGEYSFRAARL